MSEIQDIFKVPVYKTLLDIDNTKLENYAMSQYRKSKGRYISNVGGWQSDEYFESDNIKPINELISSIQKELPLFTDHLDIRAQNKVDNIWININGYRDYNNSHIHSNSLISGVYYVKTHKDCGVIRFNHPCFNLYDTIWNNVNNKAYNNYNSPTWWLPSTEGVLYLFPSWLEHLVTPNFHKTKKRISISFNVI